MSERPELVRRLEEYCDRHGLVVGRQLGFGVHGIVFEAKSKTDPGRWAAVKAHEREKDYCQERDVYFRLDDNGVKQVRGLNVPQMCGYGFDDDL